MAGPRVGGYAIVQCYTPHLGAELLRGSPQAIHNQRNASELTSSDHLKNLPRQVGIMFLLAVCQGSFTMADSISRRIPAARTRHDAKGVASAMPFLVFRDWNLIHFPPTTP
jgi:hypothetical protein